MDAFSDDELWRIGVQMDVPQLVRFARICSRMHGVLRWLVARHKRRCWSITHKGSFIQLEQHGFRVRCTRDDAHQSVCALHPLPAHGVVTVDMAVQLGAEVNNGNATQIIGVLTGDAANKVKWSQVGALDKVDSGFWGVSHADSIWLGGKPIQALPAARMAAWGAAIYTSGDHLQFVVDWHTRVVEMRRNGRPLRIRDGCKLPRRGKQEIYVVASLPEMGSSVEIVDVHCV